MWPRTLVLSLLVSLVLVGGSEVVRAEDDFPPPAPKEGEPAPPAAADADLTPIEDGSGEAFRVDVVGARSIIGGSPRRPSARSRARASPSTGSGWSRPERPSVCRTACAARPA